MVRCRASHALLAILFSLPFPTCVATSGRLDPFPAKMAELHPGGLVVGITRFADVRAERDQIALHVKSVPPPRVFLEEAILVTLQRKGVNGLLVSSPEHPSREFLVELARTLDLDAVLTAQVRDCGEELTGGAFQHAEAHAFCSLSIVLYNRDGRVVHSDSGVGRNVSQMGFLLDADAFHGAVLTAIEELADQLIGKAFMDSLQRASTRNGGGVQ